MGRLGADPELRRTQSGRAVASVSLAVDRDYKGQDGQRATDWFPVVAWGSTAEFLTRYFSRGRAAVVSGRLQVRSWVDDQGNNRKTTEIVAENIYFGDSRRESGAYAPPEDRDQTGAARPGEFTNLAADDDDLPF